MRAFTFVCSVLALLLAFLFGFGAANARPEHTAVVVVFGLNAAICVITSAAFLYSAVFWKRYEPKPRPDAIQMPPMTAKEKLQFAIWLPFGLLWFIVSGMAQSLQLLVLIIQNKVMAKPTVSWRQAGKEAERDMMARKKRKELAKEISKMEKRQSVNPFDLRDPRFWAWCVLQSEEERGLRLDLDELARVIGPLEEDELCPTYSQVMRLNDFVERKRREHPGAG